MGIVDGSGDIPHVRTFEYSFATDGGAVGALNLREINYSEDDQKLNDNDNVVRAWIEPITDLTSGGAATVKIGVTGSDAAFVAATAFGNAIFDGPDSISALTAAVPFKVNNASGVRVVATIAAAALTAGVFRVHVEVIPGA